MSGKPGFSVSVVIFRHPHGNHEATFVSIGGRAVVESKEIASVLPGIEKNKNVQRVTSIEAAYGQAPAILFSLEDPVASSSVVRETLVEIAQMLDADEQSAEKADVEKKERKVSDRIDPLLNVYYSLMRSKDYRPLVP